MIPSCRWQNSASWSDPDDVLPPAPQVTVTNRGRSARDIRSNRICRLEKPWTCISHCDQVGMQSGGNNHLGLWREELKRKVVAIFGNCCDFVRDLLHLSLELSRDEVWWVLAGIIGFMLLLGGG